MSENVKRLRGLVSLLGDAVENGASAVERVYMQSAHKPFRILEQTPVAEPAAVVEKVHDLIVAGIYRNVRSVTRTVAKSVDVVLEAADRPPSQPTDVTEGASE